MKGRPGNRWTVVHDDAPGGPHSGDLDPSTVAFATKPDGSTDFRVLVIACPVAGCGSVSYHPIGGGAAPRQVQEMFVRHLIAKGIACPCGLLSAGRPIVQVIAHMKQHAEDMDGPGRWQVASLLP